MRTPAKRTRLSLLIADAAARLQSDTARIVTKSRHGLTARESDAPGLQTINAELAEIRRSLRDARRGQFSRAMALTYGTSTRQDFEEEQRHMALQQQQRAAKSRRVKLIGQLNSKETAVN